MTEGGGSWFVSSWGWGVKSTIWPGFGPDGERWCCLLANGTGLWVDGSCGRNCVLAVGPSPWSWASGWGRAAASGCGPLSVQRGGGGWGGVGSV